MRRLIGIVFAVIAAAAVALAFVVPKVYGGENGEKITICHATHSVTNPYVIETVDESSIADFENNPNGHGNAGINIGDIIPPFTFDGVSYPGQGDQSILENGCKLVTPTPTPTPTPTITPTPTPTPSPTGTPIPPVPTPTPTPTVPPTPRVCHHTTTVSCIVISQSAKPFHPWSWWIAHFPGRCFKLVR